MFLLKVREMNQRFAQFFVVREYWNNVNSRKNSWHNLTDFKNALYEYEFQVERRWKPEVCERTAEKDDWVTFHYKVGGFGQEIPWIIIIYLLRDSMWTLQNKWNEKNGKEFMNISKYV